ncbi:MAG: polysaccharide deacetylase family protein [Candidatus Acidiferrales bacterium]
MDSAKNVDERKPGLTKAGWLVLFLLASCLAGLTAVARPAPTVQERLGYPANARLLVIHADDFGMAHSVNRAISEALENGWVTSSSILVPCPWFPEVAIWAKNHPNADLGIHLALNSEWMDFRWGPVSSKDRVPSLLDEQGYFPLLETTVAERANPKEAEAELAAQVERARAFGIHISHLDTHMGALMGTPELAKEYQRIGRQQGLPTLWHRGPSANFPPDAQQRPDFILTDDDLEISPGVKPENWLHAYESMLAPLKPGVHHLVVHLGYDDDELRGATRDHPNWGAAWRQSDFSMVKSAEFREFLKSQGFVLVTWRELARALPADYRIP